MHALSSYIPGLIHPLAPQTDTVVSFQKIVQKFGVKFFSPFLYSDNRTVVVQNKSSLLLKIFTNKQTLQLFTKILKQKLFTKVIKMPNFKA
jgi:hypothetical protein